MIDFNNSTSIQVTIQTNLMTHLPNSRFFTLTALLAANGVDPTVIAKVSVAIITCPQLTNVFIGTIDQSTSVSTSNGTTQTTPLHIATLVPQITASPETLATITASPETLAISNETPPDSPNPALAPSLLNDTNDEVASTTSSGRRGRPKGSKSKTLAPHLRCGHGVAHGNAETLIIQDCHRARANGCAQYCQTHFNMAKKRWPDKIQWTLNDTTHNIDHPKRRRGRPKGSNKNSSFTN